MSPRALGAVKQEQQVVVRLPSLPRPGVTWIIEPGEPHLPDADLAKRFLGVHEPAHVIVVLVGAHDDVDGGAGEIDRDGPGDRLDAGDRGLAVAEPQSISIRLFDAPAVKVTMKQSPSSCRRYIVIVVESWLLMLQPMQEVEVEPPGAVVGGIERC